MVNENDSFDGLSEQIAVFEQNTDSASNAVAHFSDKMKKLLDTTKTASQGTNIFAHSLEKSLKKAFSDVTTGEKKASSALRHLATDIIDKFQNTLKDSFRKGGGNDTVNLGNFLPTSPSATAKNPHVNSSDLLRSLTNKILGFSQGGVLSQRRVVPFANGGVVSTPTLFQMAGGGSGLMGEAGPEAIMPLSRGSDGRLGVQGAGASPVNITMNIQTRDAESFRRSKSQIAADMNRALSRGRRNH